MAIHTTEIIQAWTDGYTFVDNQQASSDILKQILGNLPDHGFSYGPDASGNYVMTITGDSVNSTFTVNEI